jgi:hypothetical protein
MRLGGGGRVGEAEGRIDSQRYLRTAPSRSRSGQGWPALVVRRPPPLPGARLLPNLTALGSGWREYSYGGFGGGHAYFHVHGDHRDQALILTRQTWPGPSSSEEDGTTMITATPAALPA